VPENNQQTTKVTKTSVVGYFGKNLPKCVMTKKNQNLFNAHPQQKIKKTLENDKTFKSSHTHVLKIWSQKFCTIQSFWY